jgi:hypothetical protein
LERRLTTILAADMVGYSRLMGADEAGTLAVLNPARDPREPFYTPSLMPNGSFSRWRDDTGRTGRLIY